VKSDAECWLALANRLGIEVVAPFEVELAGVKMHFTALLPQFGARLGMVVDSDSDVLWPHHKTLIDAGYGFSCVGCSDPEDLDSAHEMLADWGWASELPKPDWL
jgi:hypothetical protein